jgi:hypothetical protein
VLLLFLGGSSAFSAAIEPIFATGFSRLGQTVTQKIFFRSL